MTRIIIYIYEFKKAVARGCIAYCNKNKLLREKSWAEIANGYHHTSVQLS